MKLVSILMMMIASGVHFVSLVGCCGVSCESRRMTLTYAGLMGALVVLQYLLAGYLFGRMAFYQSPCQKYWGSLSLEQRNNFQLSHHCFGYTNRIDILITRFRQSCVNDFEDTLRESFSRIGVVLLVLAVFQTLNLCIAALLALKGFPHHLVQKQREMQLKYHTRRTTFQ